MGFSERIDTILNWTELNLVLMVHSLPMDTLVYKSLLRCFHNGLIRGFTDNLSQRLDTGFQ